MLLIYSHVWGLSYEVYTRTLRNATQIKVNRAHTSRALRNVPEYQEAVKLKVVSSWQGRQLESYVKITLTDGLSELHVGSNRPLLRRLLRDRCGCVSVIISNSAYDGPQVSWRAPYRMNLHTSVN